MYTATVVDVVKTRMQAFPEKYKGGVASAAVDIIAEEGIGFLLAGLGPTVVGYGLEGALKFGFYETCKKLFSNVTSSTFLNFMLASVVAGAVASIVLVRTLQFDYESLFFSMQLQYAHIT